MLISSYLKENQILLEVKATNKNEAIKELFGLLKDSKEIISFEEFLNDILNREALNTTGIGNEVGIPHARTSSVKDFVIAFGCSKKGIEFGSLDGQAVKLLFLMGTPKEKNLSQYLQILSQLTYLLKEESFRNLLLNAQSPKDILTAFEKQETR